MTEIEDKHDNSQQKKNFYNKAIIDVQNLLRNDGWELIKALRKDGYYLYPKKMNIHARLIKKIGELKK